MTTEYASELLAFICINSPANGYRYDPCFVFFHYVRIRKRMKMNVFAS